MTDIPSTAELLLRADWERPRSKQTALGVSDLGGCRRRAGYQLNGQPPEKPSGSIQAVIGTAVHDAADAALRRMRDQGLIPPSSVINEAVKFGGLIGHPDLYVDGVLRDIKTVGFGAQLANYKLNGPPRRHVWQVMVYAAALIVTDRPVNEVQLDYLVRDSGESWLWSAPFDYQAVREAMQWLESVRETPLEFLARDYAPDSAQCKHCPFFNACWSGHVIDRDERSVLLVTDEDAIQWAFRLEVARERIKTAKEEEALAKGALDGLRPNDEGKAEVKLDGYPKILKWTVSQRKNLDTEAVKQDYARGGAKPPLATSTSVRLELLAPRDEDLSCQSIPGPTPPSLSTPRLALPFHLLLLYYRNLISDSSPVSGLRTRISPPRDMMPSVSAYHWTARLMTSVRLYPVVSTTVIMAL